MDLNPATINGLLSPLVQRERRNLSVWSAALNPFQIWSGPLLPAFFTGQYFERLEL